MKISIYLNEKDRKIINNNYIEKFINNFSDCKDVFIMKNDEHYDVYIGKIENMVENIENLSLLDRLILSKAASIITFIIN